MYEFGAKSWCGVSTAATICRVLPNLLRDRFTRERLVVVPLGLRKLDLEQVGVGRLVQLPALCVRERGLGPLCRWLSRECVEFFGHIRQALDTVRQDMGSVNMNGQSFFSSSTWLDSTGCGIPGDKAQTSQTPPPGQRPALTAVCVMQRPALPIHIRLASTARSSARASCRARGCRQNTPACSAAHLPMLLTATDNVIPGRVGRCTTMVEVFLSAVEIVACGLYTDVTRNTPLTVGTYIASAKGTPLAPPSLHSH
jgi:hypothetical protein